MDIRYFLFLGQLYFNYVLYNVYSRGNSKIVLVYCIVGNIIYSLGYFIVS